MNSVEFDESGLADLQAVARQLFSSDSDPRSRSYQRVLVRPKINWLRIAANCVLPLLCVWGLWELLTTAGLSGAMALTAGLAALGLYVLVRAKAMLICCVRIYQRYAPESIRKKCRFEPSCSQYMILSLEKYGLRKGLAKGIDRLKRCNIHNGGYDFP